MVKERIKCDFCGKERVYYNIYIIKICDPEVKVAKICRFCLFSSKKSPIG